MYITLNRFLGVFIFLQSMYQASRTYWHLTLPRPRFAIVLEEMSLRPPLRKLSTARDENARHTYKVQLKA